MPYFVEKDAPGNDPNAFDLDRHFTIAQDEVHFEAGFRASEVTVVVQFGVRRMGRQFHEDEMLQGLSGNIS